MDVDLPIRDAHDPDDLSAQNETGPDGYFPIGDNGFWHGGVHLRTTRPIVAIRDGTLVAYRINRRLLNATLDGTTFELSTGFVLLRHETATPLGHKLEFWSLTAHLLHWEAYRDDPTLETPVFLRAKRPEKVITEAAGKGVRLAGDAGPASAVGIVPCGARVELTGASAPNGHWAKAIPEMAKARWGSLEGWLRIDDRTSAPERGCTQFLARSAVKVLSGSDPATVEGEIPSGSFFTVGTGAPSGNAWNRSLARGRVREVTCGALHGFAVLAGAATAAERRIIAETDDPGPRKRGLAVHAAADSVSPVVAVLPKGTLVRFKEPQAVQFTRTTTYHEILEGGFVPVDRTTLQEEWAIGQPEAWDAVVRPRTPVKVSRGDILGWAGVYMREEAQATGRPLIGPDNLIHFEVFSTDAKDLMANPHNEHWFSDLALRLAPRTVLKRCEPLPEARNPTIAVDLRKDAEVRISERFPGSDHVKIWRHQVTGWKRTSELGHFRDSGYALVGHAGPFYSAPPECWCDKALPPTVDLRAQPGDYLIRLESREVPETFKQVQYETGTPRPLVTKGWAREHDLGDYYAKARRPSKAVELALAAKPASWSATLDAAPAAQVRIAGNTWVRQDREERVSQAFHKVKQGAQEGWILKEHIAAAIPAKKALKIGASTRLLTALPQDLEGLRTAAATVLAPGAELTDLGAEQSISETWTLVAFRDAGGNEVTAWARASLLGPLYEKRYVLRAPLSSLFKEMPTVANPRPNKPPPPRYDLTTMETSDFQRTAIQAAAGDALEWLDLNFTAKERWERLQVDGATTSGWLRHTKLLHATNEAPRHYRLLEDIHFLEPAAPEQIAFNGNAGDLLEVLGERASAGIAYQQVKLGSKQGWWPKADLGDNADEAALTRRLSKSVPFLLKDAPRDPPDRIHVTALRGDAVLVAPDPAVDKAFTKVSVFITRDEERCQGFAPASELPGRIPAGMAAFRHTPRLARNLTRVHSFDPATTYVFDHDAGTIASERTLDRPAHEALRRDLAGHLWAEIAGRDAHEPSGWVDLHIDLASRRTEHSGLSITSAYNWTDWRTYEEEPGTTAESRFFSEDGYCDVPSLIALIEKDTDGKARAGGAIDDDVTPTEMREALAVTAVREKLRNAACLHPSEWDAGADNHLKKWERLRKHLTDNSFREHTDYFEELQFWGETFRGTSAEPASSSVWHHHPLGFARHLKRMRGLTAEQLQRILPGAHASDIEKYIAHLNETMVRYEIDTSLLQAHFLAQVGHESAQLSSTVEGRWGGRDHPNAGELYEARFGDLMNIRPGDGKRFKGRGLIQLTGRTNYSIYGAFLGVDLTANPEIVASDPFLACDVAGWFWRRGGDRDLNELATAADDATVATLTQKINGGINGLPQRLEFFRNAKRIIID